MIMKKDFTSAANDNRDLSYRAGTRGRWRRDSLQAFRDSQKGERILDDGLALLRIFDEMEKSPTAKAALAWARQNRIEFIVDHTIDIGAGYYHPGTGVVALAARHATKDDLGRSLGMIVHEIRHAWQDYHGLLPMDAATETNSLARHLVVEALCESDAEAHAALARAEYDLFQTEARLVMLRDLQKRDFNDDRARLIDTFERAADTGRAARDNAAAFLWESVLEWYDPWGMSDAYGAYRRMATAAALQMGDAVPAPAFEYSEPAATGASPADALQGRHQLETLGRSFAGVNYITAAADRDLMARQHLAPSVAERGFDPDRAAAPADVLSEAIRIRQIRARLAAHPLPRRPLPK